MKKIFTLTLLLAVLLSTQFASAQKTLYVCSKSGDLSAHSVNKVTFDNLFTFTYGDVTEVTRVMFAASFKVAFKSDDYKSFKRSSEVGICFSDVNENPTISDGKIVKGWSLEEYSFSLNNLEAGTTYYYRAYVKVKDAVFYGDVMSETTFGKKPAHKVINGHKFIDLGLPSGLLWAETNIGAAKPADDGNYYAWGETEAKSIYDWSTYKYSTSVMSDRYVMAKYNSSDGKTTLAQEDDAAYVNWGTSCRMPTAADFDELLNTNNCTWTWISMTTSDGSSINGYKVTSVKNGSSIFLPASGYRYGGLNNHGSDGYYWSSTLVSSYCYYAYQLYLYSSYYKRSNDYRYYGRTVRPVAEP